MDETSLTRDGQLPGWTARRLAGSSMEEPHLRSMSRRFSATLWTAHASLSGVHAVLAGVFLANYIPVVGLDAFSLVLGLSLAAIRSERRWIVPASALVFLAGTVIQVHWAYPVFFRVSWQNALFLGVSYADILIVAMLGIRVNRVQQGVVYSAAVVAVVVLFSQVAFQYRSLLLIPLSGGALTIGVVELIDRLRAEQKKVLAAGIERVELAEHLAAATATVLDQQYRSSLSLVAAGIAHEVNNPIQYLQGNLELLKERIVGRDAANKTGELSLDRSGPAGAEDPADGASGPGGSETEEMLESLSEGIRQISAVVERLQILYKSDGSTGERSVELRDVVQSCFQALPTGLTRNASLENSVSPGLVVRANPADLHVVISNLVRNGLQAVQPAMENQRTPPGPERSVKDPCVVVSVTRLAGRVTVCVEDNGVGMTVEQVERAFRPFESGSANKGGFGIGLALCKAIAERNGHWIALHSRPGVGTQAEYTIPDKDA